MPNNDSTDNSYVNDATTDSAKIWDGDEYSEATWLNEIDDDIEADSQLRDLVHSNIVMLRNGKIATDSKSAALAIEDGTATKIRAHASCATPFPPGKYIAASLVETETAAIGTLRSPAEYDQPIPGTPRVALDTTSAADDAAKNIDAIKDQYVVGSAGAMQIESVNARLSTFILNRIGDKAKKRELKMTHGTDGRAILAALHVEVRNRSLGSEG